MRILERIGRTVSVTGIGNHELPGLDIVTSAAVLHTNHGKVILIMHSVPIMAGATPSTLPVKLTEVDNLQGVPPTGGEGETMVTP